MKSLKPRLLLLAGLLGLMGIPERICAQWATQPLVLQSGWNVVFLEVQPVPDDCATVFAGLPVESVWRWNRRFSSVQYINNPGDLELDHPDWLVYLPATHPLSERSTLYVVEGGRPYLIKLTAAWEGTITGKVIVPRRDWVSDSLNFVGFQLPESSPPSFTDFFAGNGDLQGAPVYRLSEAGRWGQVDRSLAMRPGEAFWIQNHKAASFSGPIGVRLPQSTGLNYGEILQEQTLELRNQSGQSLSVMVRPLASAPAVEGEPPVAGPVALSYWYSEVSNGVFEWLPLTQTLQQPLAPGQAWKLRLAVRRADMSAVAPDSVGSLAQFQSILEVTDSLGLSRALLPVTAEKRVAASAGALQTLGVGKATLDDWWSPGLWVGSAVLNQVSETQSANPEQPSPAASEFSFRLLLHRDGNGRVRLLQKVVQMWKQGTTKPDPDDPNRQVVDVPGRYVLITRDSLLSQYSGSVLRDGARTGRRLSSAAFGFEGEVDLNRQPDGRWTGDVVLGYDDPLNPFKHLHHPDHDNLRRDFETPHNPGRESFAVTRQLELEFTPEDPAGLRLAGWGDNQLGGIYRERIYGLISGPAHRPIRVEGTFRLQRVSLTDSLNDEE